MTEYVWMEVTRDKYEFPVCVASTATELARILGKSESTIYNAIYRARGRGGRCRYVKVPLQEDDA